MRCYDEQLRQLQARCARKKKLEAAVEELRTQRDTYTAHVRGLKQRFREEQADVDRLEGQSLSAFFYSVIGKKDEKLTEEKMEAYAARIKYDAAAGELAGIQEDLDRCQAELDSLQDCERSYDTILRRFKTELADVTITADFQVGIDGFLRVADYLFDGFFADWMVLDRIQQSRRQVQETRSQIRSTLDDLRTLINQSAMEKADVRRQIQELVNSVPL